MNAFVFSGIGLAIAVVATALLCRHRVVRKKRVGFGTTALGALIASSVAFLAGFISEFGSAILRLSFWSHYLADKESPMILFVLGFDFAACMLAAMVTVIVYQVRSRHESHVA